MEDYTILFEKLAEASAQPLQDKAEATAAELDEIAELTQTVIDITQPMPISFTTT